MYASPSSFALAVLSVDNFGVSAAGGGNNYAAAGSYGYSGTSSNEFSGLPYMLTTVCEYAGHWKGTAATATAAAVTATAATIGNATAGADSDATRNALRGTNNNAAKLQRQHQHQGRAGVWPYPPKLPSVGFMGRS